MPTIGQPLIPMEGRYVLGVLHLQAGCDWPQVDKSALDFLTGKGAALQPPEAGMGAALFPIWGT